MPRFRPTRSASVGRDGIRIARALSLRARAAVALTVSTLLLAAYAEAAEALAAAGPRARAAMTMQLGRGLGPFRIGMERMKFDGRLRTIRQRENDRGGCSGGFRQDSFIDVYAGLRLGYIFTFKGGTYLDTIATTRAGDRTSLGFVIGKSTLADVRRRYPGVRLSRHLGGTTLTLFHSTGYESGATLTYSFDASTRLVALETSVGGC